MNPEVIQIILPTGDAIGLRVIELQGWAGKAFIVPRGNLSDFQERNEATERGLYFLFGGEDEEKKVYIGKSENVINRLGVHHSRREEEDWNVAIVFSGGLDGGMTDYLESKSIALAQDVGRYQVTNTSMPRNNLPEAQRIATENYFQKIKLILPLFGFVVLMSVPTKEVAKDIYVFSQGGASGQGTLLESGEFVVFEGATARKQISSAFPQASRRLREELINGGILKDHDENLLIFTQNHIFKSPSGAGNMIAGVATDGWMCWKDKDGKTLDENVRQKE